MKFAALLTLLTACAKCMGQTPPQIKICDIKLSLDHAVKEMLKTNKDCYGRFTLDKIVQGIIKFRLFEIRAAGHLCYMGMRSHGIYNERITASSFFGPKHEPYQARLDNSISSSSTGSWSAKKNGWGEYLQVDFGREVSLAGVITQGRPGVRQWVGEYQIKCGKTVSDLKYLKEGGSAYSKAFIGNTDNVNKVYNRFPRVEKCRYIQILPIQYFGHMSMRVEFVAGGCFNNPHLPY